ncbi:hypothetical protein MY4038_002994 [Beauveria bassiana]
MYLIATVAPPPLNVHLLPPGETPMAAPPFSVRLLASKKEHNNASRQGRDQLLALLPRSTAKSGDLGTVGLALDRGSAVVATCPHHQLLLGREVVTEQMDMHLVWTAGRMFFKPHRDPSWSRASGLSISFVQMGGAKFSASVPSASCTHMPHSCPMGVDVDGFTHATPFFSTEIGRAATKVNWKTSMLKTPVFRRSVRSAAGGWEKSSTDPMKYSAYAFYLDRIGSDMGSEDKWTSYCMRRGNANALLKVAPNPVVNQVMRHDPMTGCLANAYLNRRVGFNTQDAYLERDPSADGLTKAFSHMSIRCNPEVPRAIPKAELAGLPPDPEVVQMTREVKETAIKLRQQYGLIKSAPADVQDEYKRRRCDLRNAEKAFKEDMTKEYQEAYHRRMHNEELERQLNGVAVEEKAEPSVEHQVSERTYLQPILCDFSTDMGLEEITGRKIRAIDGMVRLASWREVRRPQSVSPYDASRESSSEMAESKFVIEPEPFEDIPLLLGKTQCIYCVGDERLARKTRLRKFKRTQHMMDHVESVHLRHEEKNTTFVCRHPKCRHLGDFLPTLDSFKNHVRTVHGVKLRE